MRIYDSILDLVGKTPLVRTRLFKEFKAEVVLKLGEYWCWGRLSLPFKRV
jgi:cysteine synthase